VRKSTEERIFTRKSGEIQDLEKNRNLLNSNQ